jgi:hypothetical protein
VFDLESLFVYLQKVGDTRKEKGKRYIRTSLLILMLLAKLGGVRISWAALQCGSGDGKELWGNYEILAKPQAACHMTYWRVFHGTISLDGFEGMVQVYQ